ncbi:hypothetical protein GGS20DRAFT_593996 [Poronia punctata]|nr:hypothetical protein GGS20DRAFT_593996 [Poronia punctata]
MWQKAGGDNRNGDMGGGGTRPNTTPPTMSSSEPSSAPTQTGITDSKVGSQDGEDRNAGKPCPGFGGFQNERKGLDPATERIQVAIGSLVFKGLKNPERSGTKHRRIKRSCLPIWHVSRQKSANNTETNNGLHTQQKVSEEPSSTFEARNFSQMRSTPYYDQEKQYPTVSEGPPYPSLETVRSERAELWRAPEPYPLHQQNQNHLGKQQVDVHHNPPEIALQPLQYNATKGQVYRVSEMSSLSSGFGDGDIIVTQPDTAIPHVGDGRETWIRRSWRDSVCATTITERPNRFRSIHSWLDQQKMRFKGVDSSKKPTAFPAAHAEGVLPADRL